MVQHDEQRRAVALHRSERRLGYSEARPDRRLDADVEAALEARVGEEGTDLRAVRVEDADPRRGHAAGGRDDLAAAVAGRVADRYADVAGAAAARLEARQGQSAVGEHAGE